jgi:hypothetical protein
MLVNRVNTPTFRDALSQILQTNLANELLSGMPLGKLPRSSCIKAALLTCALLFEHVLKGSEGSDADLAAATLGLADLHSQLGSVITRLKQPDAGAVVSSAALPPQQEEEACRSGLVALADIQAQASRLHNCALLVPRSPCYFV